MAPPGPKSTNAEEIDEIYQKDDPIECSLDTRKTKNSGNLFTAVKGHDSKMGKFFFTLKSSGEVPITKAAIMNNAKEEGRIDQNGNIIRVIPTGPDLIEKSLDTRIKAQGHSYMTTVPDKTKKAESVFALKLKGGQPKLSEVKPNTSLGSMNKEAAE